MTISMMIKTAVGYASDLIKDILLVVMISLSQGGFAKLIMQKDPYIKGVSPLLLLLGLGVLFQQNIRKLLQKINFIYFSLDLFHFPWINYHPLAFE